MTIQVLLVSDIFGRCEGLRRLIVDLSAPGVNLHVIDPYQGLWQNFTDEQQAYAAYSEQCGHEAYTALVAQRLTQHQAVAFDLALGFSAGASALWRALAHRTAPAIKQALLFYPGQIYPYLQLTPKVPVRLVFGRSEPHFDVVSVCTELNAKTAVSAQHTRYAHGFLNPASAAFDEKGYRHWLKLIVVAFDHIVVTAKKNSGLNANKPLPDLDLLAYVKTPASETVYIDIVTASKTGRSYIYQGERWARQPPYFLNDNCVNDKGSVIHITPLSRHDIAGKHQDDMVTAAAKQRYQLWVAKMLKQSRQG